MSRRALSADQRAFAERWLPAAVKVAGELSRGVRCPGERAEILSACYYGLVYELSPPAGDANTFTCVARWCRRWAARRPRPWPTVGPPLDRPAPGAGDPGLRLDLAAALARLTPAERAAAERARDGVRGGHGLSRGSHAGAWARAKAKLRAALAAYAPGAA